MPMPWIRTVYPAVVGRVQPGRLARRDPPELLLAVAQVAVVVAVVADPEVASPGPIPVAEQHRQRAPGRRQRDRGVVASAAGGRSDQLVVRAQVVRILGVGVGDVVAERQGRQARRTLPGRAERGRDRVAAGQPPRLVGPLEAATAEAAESDVLAVPQDHEVDRPVAVDVERVGADDGGEIGGRIGDLHEPQRATDRALVAVQGGRAAPARDVQVGPAVAVAIE